MAQTHKKTQQQGAVGQEPRKHHWMTKGFMNPWLGSDKCVQRFYRPHSKVISRRHAPRGFAWEQDLYRITAPSAKNPVAVEEAIGKIENAALKVRDKILENGVNGLTPKQRAEFAMFLALLMVRRPEYVRPKIEPAQKDWEAKVLEAFAKPIADGKISEESVLALTEGHGTALVLGGMLESAKHWAAQIAALSWRSFDVTSGGLPLVLSDHPFLMWCDQGKGLAKITIPLSPHVVFVGGEAQSWTEVRYRPEFRQALAIDFIGDQFRSATQFVIGLDNGPNDVYLKLANNNWGTKAPAFASNV